MTKTLSEMSLEELWQLFPIILKEHNPLYETWYYEERDNITKAIGQSHIVRINHIGSTAVKDLLAKPTIDILLEVNLDCKKELLTKKLQHARWTLMANEDEQELCLIFNKGYTKTGFLEKVYHLHIRHAGDHSELYFRDYLKKHPDIAEQYATLKRQLKKQFEHDRNAYTEAKSDFINTYTQKARIEFGKCYAIYE